MTGTTLLARDDDALAWEWWPQWDLLELEDIFDLFPEDAQSELGDVDTGPLRARLAAMLRDSADGDERFTAQVAARCLGDRREENVDVATLLQEMGDARARPWERVVDPDAMIVRQRCLLQSLGAAAWPARFVAPRISVLTFHFDNGVALPPHPPLPLRCLAARVLADAVTGDFGEVDDDVLWPGELIVAARAQPDGDGFNLRFAVPTRWAGPRS